MEAPPIGAALVRALVAAQLPQWDDEVERVVQADAHRLDADAVRDAWWGARSAPGPEGASWVHGDVAPGNLLVQDGRLVAAIDFGQACVGDPACDLALAWQRCDAEGRALLREAAGADADAWRRGAGWALGRP